MSITGGSPLTSTLLSRLARHKTQHQRAVNSRVRHHLEYINLDAHFSIAPLHLNYHQNTPNTMDNILKQAQGALGGAGGQQQQGGEQQQGGGGGCEYLLMIARAPPFPTSLPSVRPA